MHILDAQKIRREILLKGYGTIQNFSKALGLHRNTVQAYLSEKGILPKSLESILEALDLDLAQVLLKKDDEALQEMALLGPVLDAVLDLHPACCIVLFGSRVQGAHHKYSDWDLGVFSSAGLEHSVYRKMRVQVAQQGEALPWSVDLVNFNRADIQFLQNASKGWRFLAGRRGDWSSLQRKLQNERERKVTEVS